MPAVGDGFEFGRIQPDEIRQRREIRPPAGLSGCFQRGQFRFGNTRRGCRRCGGNAAHRPCLANNVTQMIFKNHAGTVAVGAHDRKHTA